MARSPPMWPPTPKPAGSPLAPVVWAQEKEACRRRGAAPPPCCLPETAPPHPHHLEPSRSASLAQTKTLRLCHLQGNDITPQAWASLEQLVADPANSLESIEGSDNATAELMGTVCLVQ